MKFNARSNLFSQVSQCYKIISIVKTVTFMRTMAPPSHLWGLNVPLRKWWDEQIEIRENFGGTKKKLFGTNSRNDDLKLSMVISQTENFVGVYVSTIIFSALFLISMFVVALENLH